MRFTPFLAAWSFLYPALPALSAVAGLPASSQDSSLDDMELAALVAAERREADLLRRRGNPRGAGRLLDELIEEDPEDAASRTLRALCLIERGRIERALADAKQALADARAKGEPELGARCTRNLVHILLTLGRSDDALELLNEATDLIEPERDVRDAWILGRALDASGARAEARLVFQHALYAEHDPDWRSLLAKGNCERALGRIERASHTFVYADKAAQQAGGAEPDILVALADLYFESEREVAAKGQRSAGDLYRKALEINPQHESGLLGQFRLHRYNRRRSSRSPESILADILDANPKSIDGLIASASTALDDGQLRAARGHLTRLGELAPLRRETQTMEAALAWVEHRREDCEGILEELTRTTPMDSRPEREVGRHLIELYRFAEAEPFLERAVERDPTDHEAWTYLGRALANVGREDDAREALDKAKIAAAGRQDAWRNNMQLVLEHMRDQMVEEDFGELSFAWQPDAAEVLRTYLVPFYEQAREELAERYGYTPDPTHIEVFRKHEDFSVRSVGFQGFPALGVCFGPVVTSLSPLSHMRGSFSWARTSFHEFSHVIHLGLSHNRCPRWITEGLATWEEVNKSPMWTRNMRRELIDARANANIIPVRALNRAFRGPRIIFGYYQGGLLCRMLIRENGFRPMIRLLEAFDRGLDLDQAMTEVFATTPEQLDADFLVFVDEFLEGIEIEPRWQAKGLARLRLRLRKDAPPDDGGEAASQARTAWGEDWCTLAWGSWQAGAAVDAEEALRLIARAGLQPVRAEFLRGEMALAAGDRARARSIWSAAVEAGGRDYRALIALGTLHAEEGNDEDAEACFEMAEAAFPGYGVPKLSAELALARALSKREDEDGAMRARERWLDWNAGNLPLRREVAAWHFENGRFAEASQRYEEANEIDLFLRDMHRDWGLSLKAEGRYEEALREFRVATLIPPELDTDYMSGDPNAGMLELPEPNGDTLTAPEARAGQPLSASERAQLWAHSGDCLVELGRLEEAGAAAQRALGLDPECELSETLQSTVGGR